MFEHKEGMMDEKIQKKIIRQLRAIRLGLGLIILLVLAGFAMSGFLLFKTSGVINDTQKQINAIESQANSITEARDTICGNGLVSESALCSN